MDSEKGPGGAAPVILRTGISADARSVRETPAEAARRDPTVFPSAAAESAPVSCRVSPAPPLSFPLAAYVPQNAFQHSCAPITISHTHTAARSGRAGTDDATYVPIN